MIYHLANDDQSAFVECNGSKRGFNKVVLSPEIFVGSRVTCGRDF